jgi:hypothetical protein
MHLTDEQLNEYLDNETDEREQIESHLNTCNECSIRFSDLQNLFLELESLPEMQLTRDLSTRFVTKGQLTLGLPRWLTLTVALQAALALVALIVSIPFITTLLPQIDTNSLLTPIFEIQSLWNVWLESLSTIQLPTIPELPIPIMEMSSLLLTIASVSILWIFGNGLLLRNQIRRR